MCQIREMHDVGEMYEIHEIRDGRMPPSTLHSPPLAEVMPPSGRDITSMVRVFRSGYFLRSR